MEMQSLTLMELAQELRESLEGFNQQLFDADLQNRLAIPNLDRRIIKVEDL